jgi:hypothetical protein
MKNGYQNSSFFNKTPLTPKGYGEFFNFLVEGKMTRKVGNERSHSAEPVIFFLPISLIKSKQKSHYRGAKNEETSNERG